MPLPHRYRSRWSPVLTIRVPEFQPAVRGPVLIQGAPTRLEHLASGKDLHERLGLPLRQLEIGPAERFLLPQLILLLHRVRVRVIFVIWRGDDEKTTMSVRPAMDN